MSAWNLPTSVKLGGKKYKIRSDFRAIIDILCAVNDPDLFTSEMTEDEKEWEKVNTMLYIFYPDYESIPVSDYQEAIDQCCTFIDCGIKDSAKQKPQLMDWNQDAPIIIPAVNKVAGKDVRSIEYMHWWTFFGLYMEIGESVFSTVVKVRESKRKGKMEKWEKEFYQNNKCLVDLKSKKSERSESEKESLRKLLGLSK